MSASEPARLDLYNGLSEVLGPQRAETLMTYLPTFEVIEIATKPELLAVEARLSAKIDATNARIDRLVLALLASQSVLVAAMIGVLVSVR